MGVLEAIRQAVLDGSELRLRMSNDRQTLEARLLTRNCKEYAVGFTEITEHSDNQFAIGLERAAALACGQSLT